MFIARQPIFDRELNVYGYELLYRGDEKADKFNGYSALSSTASVLGGLFELGIENISGDKKAFINFDYEFLMSGLIELIPADKLVIEVLENTLIDDDLIKQIKHFKEKGYKIALDDFECEYETYPIMSDADIIKYDLIITPLSDIRKDVKRALEDGKILLAEKIETEEEYIEAKSMGFKLFQGYFFSKPKIVAGLKVKKTPNTVYGRILRELRQEEPSYLKIAHIIETDINLAYRIIKFTSKTDKSDIVNTVKFSLSRMGLKELERWVHIMMLQEIGGDKPIELTRLALIRARFGELIALGSIYKKRKDDISLMCLFSLLDAMLDDSMENILKEIYLSDDIKDTLINETGEFSIILNLVKTYEAGDWGLVSTDIERIKVDKNKLFKWYIEAIKWSDKIISSI